MNFRSLDLNLLGVFDAVMQDRSVTKAAGRLHMAQPALSHALTRLRRTLRDELFIRTPEGMAPTPKAESLAEGVRAALDDLRAVLDGTEPFVPGRAERGFVFAVNNFAALVLAAPIAAEVAAEAPGCGSTFARAASSISPSAGPPRPPIASATFACCTIGSSS